MTALKICGVTTTADAASCRALGVDAIGINFWAGSRRAVPPSRATAIADAGRGGPAIVGVFVDEDPRFVAQVARRARLDAIQPHGEGSPARYAALGIPWVWVIRSPQAPLEIPTPAPQWVLLDAPTPGLGGQGVLADWTWAARVVRELAPVPVWLAGGLRPDNAREAIATVRPAGLDIASGAELSAEDPRKDRGALRALVAICREGREAATK